MICENPLLAEGGGGGSGPLRRNTKTIIKSQTLIRGLCENKHHRHAQAQDGAKYLIKEITVTGNTNFSPQTIIAYSKLRKDEEIQVGGEKIANAVKTLWKSNLFSSIDIFITDIDGSTVLVPVLNLVAVMY